AVIEGISPDFQPPAAWRARTEALRNLSSLEPARLPAEFNGVLRPYQRLGAAWLWFLHRQRLGGILADEMGLGKTLQALALLVSVHSGDKSPGRGASLVVAPASLLENWRREAARFAPGLRVFVHHGGQRLGGIAGLKDIDLVVTSYGTLVRDRELFEAVEFPCLVADEAQHIKNRRSQNAQALRALKAQGRVLLTGTPLENSLEDLRSLFEFLLPGYLPALPQGMKAEERAWHDERLLARTAPYILRRTKQAVAPELPAKIEQRTWCEMSPTQAALYRATQERSERELIDMAAGGANEARLRFAMLTQLLRLRQICCDPRLLGGSGKPVEGDAQGREADSAKLALLRELIDEALDDGHRVLVFSQFTSMLALIGEALTSDGIGFCSLDGSMTARARQAEVDRFQGSDSVPVFLLSLKAGGVGLNLTGADTVIHFDPWWNPAAEAQATDRAHRIGQTRTVTSYKLVCSGTVEEKVLALQEEKRALLADVFEASDAAAAKLSLADLRGLLSPG
ncbi:MAG: DEAD/DEAH box helicase, partial [Opitutaceae bacterium]